MSNTKRPNNPAASGKSTPRSTQIVVVAMVLVCVVAVAAIAFFLNRSDDDDSATGTASQESATPTEATGAEPEEPEPLVEGCEQPPAPPQSPQSFDAPPDPARAESATWIATVATTCGDIVLGLDGKLAPQTVASFLFLSEEGYYDDSPCHRLTTQNIFVLQCGDPTGTGSGSPGYGYGIENAPKDGTYPTGTLAMARTQDPNSNGSQFFIVFKETMLPVEGGGYSIFGKVTEGLDLLTSIAAAGVEGGAADGAPAQPVSILDISVEKA